MKRLDAILEDAVAKERTPGVVVSVATRDGVVYEGAAGKRALGGAAAMTADSVFRAFSMTKAVAAAAAAKAIQDGLVALDTPVEDLVPEWRQVKLLEGFDADGKPILRAPKVKATLRHLASHTSGLPYEFWNANQARYMEATGLPPMLSGKKSALFSYPLAFEPGTDWVYGVGIDWLGQMLEAATGTTIDAYVKQKILEPLGMADTAFEVAPHMADRLVGAHMATPKGWRAHEIAPPPDPEFYGMGHALYTTGPDYLRFIRMLLMNGSLEGEQVLAPETAAMLCASQTGDILVKPLPSTAPPLSADIDLFPGQEKKFSLACMVNMEDVEGRRRAGSQSWAGVLNTHYWFDPAAGVACVIMMQHLPFVDANAMAVYEAVERAVYEALG